MADTIPAVPGGLRPNVFSASPLDRLDARRRDAAWIEARCGDPQTLFAPVWRSRNLVRRTGETMAPAWLGSAQALPLLGSHPWALLGERHGVHLFAIDFSAWDEASPQVQSMLVKTASFEDLRRMGGLLAAEDAAILAHARGLMFWRTHARFCAACGAHCTPRNAGHVVQCEGCGTHHFPRTDPAVIMLVTHEDRVLLGQPQRFRDWKVFTTLAGFVEPGETLEEAVAREVMEEAGVRVADVRYHSSQPWPFPSSIMLGFSARAISPEIRVDHEELVDARWFTRAELAEPDGFVLPPDISIARRLIDGWREGAFR